jgi:hypothetical protein
MGHIFKRITIILIILAITFFLVLFNRPRKLDMELIYQDKPVGTIMTTDRYHTSDVTPIGFDAIAENDFLKLLIDPQTSYFAVLDKRNDYVWYSNVRGIDLSATKTYRNLQKSTLGITYKESDDTTHYLTNYAYSIEDEQFEIEYFDDGFQVDYTIADRSPKGYWFPTKIARDRYIQLVLNPFEEYAFDSEAERVEYTNYLRNAYVQLEDDPDTYVLALVTGDNTSSDLAGIDVLYLFEIFYEIGDYGNREDENGDPIESYHLDDVAYDNAQYDYVVDLTDPEFMIPVKIELLEDRIEAVVLTEKMIANAPFEIVSLDVLPYFGAADTNETGYMIIPEGSGGLIELNNGKTTQRSYASHVYGRDHTLIPNHLDIDDVGIRLPYYGMKHDRGAVLTTIDQGAEHARITAEVSGKSDAYNRIHARFTLKDSGLYYLTQAGIPIWNTSDYHYHPTISYYFFADDEANYNDMAKLYGNYLEARYDLNHRTNGNPSLYLDLLGSYDYEDYFLFFPYENTASLTTFQQAKTIIERFESKGIDRLVLDYVGWFNKGIDHRLPKRINKDRVLGSTKDLESLNAYVEDHGHVLYFNVDFVRLHDKPTLYSNQNIARIVGGTLNERYPFDIASGLPDTTKDPYYYLKVQAIQKHTESFLKDFKKTPGHNLSLRHLGEEIYGDFHTNDTRARYEITPYYQNIMASLGASRSLMLSNTNAYGLPFVSHLKNLSIESSKGLLLDHAIPFYQLAIAGRIDYAMPSINLDQVYPDAYYLLKALETGSNLKFTLSYQNSSQLLDTNYNTYFAIEFDLLFERITDLQKTYQSLFKDGGNLTKHEIIGDTVVTVEYDNGLRLLLDYDALTYTILD